MPNDPTPADEPTTPELLEEWRTEERSARAAQRAAEAAERASIAAERAAVAAERVAEAALKTLAMAQESLDVVRASVAEARAAATAAATESGDKAMEAKAAKGMEGASRDRYQQKTGEGETTTDRDDARTASADKRDMSAVGDDGQVFGG